MDLFGKKYMDFKNNILIIGFGSIGQGVLPLIFRHLIISPAQITIITKTEDGASLAKQYGVQLIANPVTQTNYQSLLETHLEPNDLLLNLSVDVSSLALIEWCQNHEVLYLDTCVEPWAGGYFDTNLSAANRTNYALRENVLALKNKKKITTAVITHGANPGLVSHFIKQALINISDHQNEIPKTQSEWANLAKHLNIKTIHIAERDTQVSAVTKKSGEFVNTWSVDGFISEGSQPAELGWGTHEKKLPQDGSLHDFGSQCAIYLNRPGASTRVRTWTPLAGAFHGFLITHHEAMSIANYLTVKDENNIHYRPTVHYAYHPCEDAVLSLHELAGREWLQQQNKRLLLAEIVDGTDELGVLLMGNEKGAYWFGSQLSIHEARKLAPHNNATSLQVSIGVLAGMIWAIKHPHKGIVEPDEMDFQFIMEIALPYLGKVAGHYTNWTPLKERERLFPESIDHSDPWQFSNIRVM